MSDTIIVAPHGDDEIIGCYEILENPKINPIIIYTEEMNKERQTEVQLLKDYVSIKGQMFCKSIPPNLLNKDNTFYFPHPIHELHPAHRFQGMVGEGLARQGINVIFYTTNMNAPFIRECKNPTQKKYILDSVYESQSDLWKYDHKYFLFEGYCKWLF